MIETELEHLLDGPRARRREFPREFPPRQLAYLGELGPCVLRDPRDGSFHVMNFVPGRVLAAAAHGREMYVLKPFADAGRVRPDGLALDVFDLHERFVHRRASGYYNCFIPPFRRPRFAGEMAILTYYAEKGDLGDVEWVHHFEEPGEEPRYAPVYHLGFDQLFFPRGPWCVSDEGIVYAEE